MKDIEYYRSLALAELQRALDNPVENGVEDKALDAAIRTIKRLPVRHPETLPYVRLFPPLPNPLPRQVLDDLVGSKRAETWHPHLNAAIREAYILSPLEICHLLAQVLHETGGLWWLEEIWGPTEAQRRYEGRKDLGNVVPGDGYLYRGRGLIHLTGRNNYARAGAALGLPLVDHPEMASQPEAASRIAAWYWNQRGIGRAAQMDDLESVTRAVNGGLNGLEDRRRWLGLAKAAYGIH